MELTKEQQLELWDRNADLIFERVLQEMIENRDVILAVGRERLEEGFDLYGCTMWGWTRPLLLRNRIEEYSDGCVYYLPEL